MVNPCASPLWPSLIHVVRQWRREAQRRIIVIYINDITMITSVWQPGLGGSKMPTAAYNGIESPPESLSGAFAGAGGSKRPVTSSQTVRIRK